MTTGAVPAGSWSFAVSGDSRDCGDIIMPKIAQYIADHPTQPAVSFYWHLGDFRALYRVDCDYGKRGIPSFRCKPEAPSPDQKPAQLAAYRKDAWPDFLKLQIDPFKQQGILVFLGIGNHEVMGGKSRDDFKVTFKDYLKQDWIEAQWKADVKNKIASPETEGETYYHFIRNGVDFIYLDNSTDYTFTQPEIAWLFKVLDADAQNDSVRTIVVGMHEALPGSNASNHAMDDAHSCTDLCSAERVYDRLYQAQQLGGPAAKQKHVYLFASHSHYFMDKLYDTPEHAGRVLPGWLIGTAGAEQPQDKIQKIKYGYLQVKVKSDGTIDPQFKEVTRDQPPSAGKEITTYCFEQNKIKAQAASKDRCTDKCPSN